MRWCDFNAEVEDKDIKSYNLASMVNKATCY